MAWFAIWKKHMKAVQQHFDLIDKTFNPKGIFAKTLSKSLKEFSPYFKSKNTVIFNGDCLEILNTIPENSINMIFADPPYMLSNDGFTCQNGKMVNVNKGKWDKSNGFENDTTFHN